MSFTGDLEHLPIVDVIQLLHSTRKSGILKVICRKGESELVFKDGCIVSASHLNNSVRIGTVLIDLNLITQETLDKALEEQNSAGAERKPLIVTLLDMGLVVEDDAYRGLSRLIEMTIVEILTWKRGSFSLDILPQSVADGFRYYPSKIGKEINIDTQSVLMDSLRIYDEKIRDGELKEEDFPDDDPEPVAPAPPPPPAAPAPVAPPQAAPAPFDAAALFPPAAPPPPPKAEDVVFEFEDGGPPLSADDLGLDDLDQVEKRIPKIFKPLSEFDPGKVHREKLQQIAPELSPEELEKLVVFLGRKGGTEFSGEEAHDGLTNSLILFSTDELLIHAMATVCHREGILLCATGDEQGVTRAMAGAYADNGLPILVLDTPASFAGKITAERMAALRLQTCLGFPDTVIIQLAEPDDYRGAMTTFRNGVTTLFPRPVGPITREGFVEEVIVFLDTVTTYLLRFVNSRDNRYLKQVRSSAAHLAAAHDPADVATTLLNFVGNTMERAITFIVRGDELQADRGIGIQGDKSKGPSLPLGFRVPLLPGSLLRRIIDSGTVYYGSASDDVLRNALFPVIHPPHRMTALVLPLKSNGKTVSLTYGDFGSKEATPAMTDLLEMLTRQADLTLENILYRKKLAGT